MNGFSQTYHILEILFMRYFFQWRVPEKDLPEEPQEAHAPPTFKTINMFLIVRSNLKKFKVNNFTNWGEATARKGLKMNF